MSEITLGSCGPDVLLSHLALYGPAAILESGVITGLRGGWNGSGDRRPYLTGQDLTGERAAEVLSRHAGQADDRGSWLHRSITLKGSPRPLMSPRLTTFGDQTTWRQAQENRHKVLDSLTDQGQWLDLRFLAALGEPCYWITDRQGAIQQDSAAGRLEMQPRNIGSEFVGTRLRKLADAIAARTAAQILSGLLGDSVRDEAGGDAADSRTATGLAGPGPTDNALAWCALWGISQLPLAMRITGMAVTTGHLGRGRQEFFYVPIWQSPWRPARLPAMLASTQLRVATSSGLDHIGHPMGNPPPGAAVPMHTGSEIVAARLWLAERGVDGVIRLGWPGGTVRRMPPVWIGLTVAFASALVTNTAYSLEHDAAAALPPLSPRRPLRSAKLLLGDRRWLAAFGAETAGWLMYVAALRLAPLSLVQAVAASGVAVLAFATARGHPSRLARREQLAVVLAVAGLVLLALSLVDTAESDQRPGVLGVVIWLAACGGGAVLLIAIPTRFARAASLGLAAGLLFADGDISAKLVGYGGWWLAALASLIVAYAVGTSVLQWAYQRGDALTAAGLATMATNAVPIAAGFVLFGEMLPHGMRAVLQVAAFGCLVASAVALGHQQAPQADQQTPPADRIGEGPG